MRHTDTHDAPLDWKGLNTGNASHIQLLQTYAHRHMSPNDALYIDSAIAQYRVSPPHTFLHGQAKAAIKSYFRLMDVSYLHDYLEQELASGEGLFYQQYGIFDPDQLYYFMPREAQQ